MKLLPSSGWRSGGSGRMKSHRTSWGPRVCLETRTVNRPLPPVDSITTHGLEQGSGWPALIYLDTVPDGNL